MSAQAKIINMLLYDGSLEGVIRIEDSNWNAGELFSAPRESVADLLKTGACNKYGVYLLISTDMVYVGQSSDLAKRLTKHMSGKDWWESAVIITTKDDSLNRSDIDFLENVLIEKAFALKKLDSDNKKSGNPPKVDVFRKVFLGQYLEEALFLMQLIGIKVFADSKATKKKKAKHAAKKPPIEITIPSILGDASKGIVNQVNVPELPSTELKVGAFVYAAMHNLEEAGFIFSDEEIDAMCSTEWAEEHFHTSRPFMKRYTAGTTDNKGTDGYIRFKSDPYSFGDVTVLISKEWYERQRGYFIDWYLSLNTK